MKHNAKHYLSDKLIIETMFLETFIEIFKSRVNNILKL